MMGGAAFILLNGTGCTPESAEQTEIRLAMLPKLLQVSVAAGEGSREKTVMLHSEVALLAISFPYG